MSRLNIIELHRLKLIYLSALFLTSSAPLYI
nr:MAG TPA: hypothetical protein [Caudoviricetes sp.]